MTVLVIKLVSGLFLLLGTGLIFQALVAMDAPSFQPRFVVRRPIAKPSDVEGDQDLTPLRKAA
jgi:hypothetical protein